jgi:hypothetical protein
VHWFRVADNFLTFWGTSRVENRRSGFSLPVARFHGALSRQQSTAFELGEWLGTRMSHVGRKTGPQSDELAAYQFRLLLRRQYR